MGRSPHMAARMGAVGAAALVAGATMIIGVAVQTLTSPVFADTAPYETVCTGTPLGNIVLNDTVLTGSLSPASPTTGQQFDVVGLQTQEQLPAAIVQSAAATGLTSLTGTVQTTVDATGATPASISTGAMAFDVPIPNPVPPSGLALDVPSAPATVGPFTATSDNIAMTADPVRQTTTIDGAGIGLLSLHCSSYANNALPAGFTQDTPPGLPISPVIATAGQVTPPPPPGLTGPYELYCPHTPVGDLDFNDVTTAATISPGTLSAGDQFQVSGYQTVIPIPPGAVTAAAGLGNGSFVGLAASEVDAYGATPSQAPTGSMGFDLPIPNPIPSSPIALDIPTSPNTVGPFTASGGSITIAENQSILVVAKLSNKAFTMSCNAFPNDSIATSGSTGVAPSSTPIRPIIATGSASGTAVTTTTTSVPGQPGPGSQTPGAPYELYCPGTPVGSIGLNDVSTTATITPSSLNEGDAFQLANLQTQFTIPQSVAQQAENLGLTTLSGNLTVFFDVTGTQYGGFPGGVVPVTPTTSVTTSASSGPVTTIPPIVSPGPIPYPFPGIDTMSFDVTLPSPVPSSGVQFTATSAAGGQGETFIAAGGPIQVFANGANLNVTAFGDHFGLFCQTLVNNTMPTGLSIQPPENGFFEPLIAAGSATVVPPPPGPPGAYELYCPGTPIGNIVLNNVDTTGTISPSDPAAGTQFNLTGYQTTLNIPASIASAAAALGNSAITGSATANVDATGATPAQISTGAMTIDAPLPSPIPPTGIALTLPSPAGTIGPFTATGGAITLAQDGKAQLDLIVSGSNLSLNCVAFPNNSAPTGITVGRPGGAPTSPVIATTAPSTTPPPTGTGATTTQPVTQQTGPTTTAPTGPGADSTTTAAPADPTTTAGAASTTTATPLDPTTTAGADTTTSSAPGGTSSTTAPVTRASSATTADPAAPSSTVSPIVSASSGALAFTGPGAATGWIVAAGSALVLLGLAMLVLADAPRRLRWAFAERRSPTTVHRLDVVRRHQSTLAARDRAPLWVDADDHRGGPRH